MDVSDRTVEALVNTGAGLAVVVVVRWLLSWVFTRWERRLAIRDPRDAVRRRTTFAFLRRVVVAVVAAIAIWNVLQLYPATDQVGKTLLASSAVLALFAGLAFNTPLSNLGSGMLVAFTQPLRLGDRVTIGEHTGFVEEMSLIYTTLVTDEDRRVFIPNSQLTSSTIVNRSIRDPRRAVSAAFPIRLGAEIHEARDLIASVVGALPGTIPDEARVLVGESTPAVVWLTATAYAPLEADVITLGSDLREETLAALGRAGLLPGSDGDEGRQASPRP